MSLTIRISERCTRRAGAALLIAGAGLAGIAGCALNLSPGERLAAAAQEEADSTPPVRNSALSRLLGKPKENTDSDDSAESTSRSTTTIGTGRLFSAIVDRFPSRKPDAADPFLEAEIEAERKRAHLTQPSNGTEHSRGEKPAAVANRSAGRARSDEELWKLFADDAASVVRARQLPSRESQNEQARPFPAVAQRPEQPRDVRRARSTPSPKSHNQAAATSAAATPASRAESRENPFARYLNEDNPARERTKATVADAARHELQDLLSQSSRHKIRSASHRDRRAMAATAGRADQQQRRSTDEPVRTADTGRRPDRRRGPSIRDPFGSGPMDSSVTSTPQGTSPFASGSSIGAALPWTTRVQPAVAPATGDEESALATTSSSQSMPFPSVPEWRGVRANSPVSLAVIEESDSTTTRIERTAVHHANTDKSGPTISTPNRLLPRNLPKQAGLFGQGDDALAFNSPPAIDGPLLAPSSDPTPVLAAPTPPMTVNTTETSPARQSAADEEIARSNGYGGWILGGMMFAIGLGLFVFRNHQPVRRRVAAGSR